MSRIGQGHRKDLYELKGQRFLEGTYISTQATTTVSCNAFSIDT
jgi:hypothetical protein